MRRLTNVDEIEWLKRQKVIPCFSNFNQILNGSSDEEVVKKFSDKPYQLFMFEPKEYLDDDADTKIYDLGCGYFLFERKEKFHKEINKWLSTLGIENPFVAFEHTTSIYRVVN